MLSVISFDAVAQPLLDRMIAQGRLPYCAQLFHCGKTHAIKGTPLHASVYRSLYTGRSLSAHGAYYPLQWCAAEQRVKPADPLNPADSIFARLDGAGKRILVIDPPECAQFEPQSGVALSGWQFRARGVLPQWYSSKSISRMLKGQWGEPRTCHEVFGRPSAPRLRTMQKVLQSAPRRLVDATVACLKEAKFDLLWITFAAAHIAGHQLWPTSSDAQLNSSGREAELLEGVYQEIDEELGRLLQVLPAKTDIILFSPNGMGPETSRADFLPAMLDKVLAGGKSKWNPGAGDRLWRLRAVIPTNLRALVADAIPDHLAVKFSASLENAHTDWSTTRAFTLPSDGPGFVRLNLKGRERHGIVNPADAEHLLDEIAAGLATFVEPSGEKMVASIVRPSDLDGPGPKAESLPDLIVQWSPKPEAGLQRVISARFGEVLRVGVGSGRSGNHCDGAWACIVAGGLQKHVPVVEPVRIVDLTSTICAVMGVPHQDLPGRPLLQ